MQVAAASRPAGQSAPNNRRSDNQSVWWPNYWPPAGRQLALAPGPADQVSYGELSDPRPANPHSGRRRRVITRFAGTDLYNLLKMPARLWRAVCLRDVTGAGAGGAFKAANQTIQSNNVSV